MQRGECLCGDVRFTLDGALRPAIGCHCGQCRKHSGHYWAATSVAEDGLHFETDAGLSWYRASDTAKRGFCQTCGSTLFWKPDNAARYVVSMGTLEMPTGLSLSTHVFVADKGDYYKIADGLPQLERS